MLHVFEIFLFIYLSLRRKFIQIKYDERSIVVNRINFCIISFQIFNKQVEDYFNHSFD